MDIALREAFAAFTAGRDRANLERLGRLFESGHQVHLEVDGTRVEVPGPVLAVLGRVVDHLQRSEDVRRSLHRDAATTMLQPVVELESGRTVGYEALSDLPVRGLPATERWLRDGARYGLVEEFELGAVELALSELDGLPSSAYLSVNVSPASLGSPELVRLLDQAPLHRLVLELTEHAPVDDYVWLEEALSGLRDRGLRIAVDDAGAGFSSLQHILRIRPEIVKLDRSLLRDIESGSDSRALIAALLHFATEIGAVTVAEGVETAAQAAALRDLGVSHAQGWFFGFPEPGGAR